MEPSLFGTIERREQCEGCLKNDMTKHNGNYCIIKDWRADSKAMLVLVDSPVKVDFYVQDDPGIF